LYLKQAPKKLLKSKRNRSQNNPPENNVEPVPAKSSTLFLADCFGGSSDLVGTVPHYFPADCFGGSSDLAGTTTKNPTQPHYCTGSDLEGTGSTLFSGGLFGGSSDMAETTTKN
jgi:hypothetical protein